MHKAPPPADEFLMVARARWGAMAPPASGYYVNDVEEGLTRGEQASFRESAACHLEDGTQ